MLGHQTPRRDERSNTKNMYFFTLDGHGVRKRTGVSNEFLVLTHAETALTYNDSSVNENMHASLAFRLLRKPANNFLEARLPLRRVFCSFN